jgi:hypothetical protein
VTPQEYERFIGDRKAEIRAANDAAAKQRQIEERSASPQGRGASTTP